MTDDDEENPEKIGDRDYSDTRWDDSTPTVDDEMTEREREVIDDRIEELEDADKRYSTEEAAEAPDIDLDDGHRRRFIAAVGAVATGYESLPAAAERRDVDPADVARALSRYRSRADYDGRLWADRRRDDA